MNKNYRIVWSPVRRTWTVVSELAGSHSKSKALCVVAMTFCGAAIDGIAFADTITVNEIEYPYMAQSNTGTPGTKDNNGGSAYIFKTKDGSFPENNHVTVKDDVIIKGGKGANFNNVNTGDGFSGSNLTIINSGEISGGDTLYNSFTTNGGNSGNGVSGNNLNITNSGSISGGKVDFAQIYNPSAETYGKIVGGMGGSGVQGDNLNINNTGSIIGGVGGVVSGTRVNYASGGNGGDAIKGNYLSITNAVGGLIKGGKGGGATAGSGYGADIFNIESFGGHGGHGVNGDNLTISNDGSIMGGEAGNGSITNGMATGGNGGDGVRGDNLTITNSGSIMAGKGEYTTGTRDTSTGTSGYGGAGINGNNLAITNKGSISGGDGGDVYSGIGSIGGTDKGTYTGGAGGDGINGYNSSIVNSGYINGGNGGSGKNKGSAIYNAREGGAGIGGNGLKIVNNGLLKGGDGGNGLNNDAKSTGGDGGDGIKGSDLLITNSGQIIKGEAGTGTNSNGIAGNAINLTGGNNNITLNEGSNITGDIVLSGTALGSDINTLSVISNAATAVKGGLNVGSNSHFSLSGETLTFSDSAGFGEGASLIFNSLTDGVALKADSIIFHNSNIGSINKAITNWTQSDYTLATTENGISGTYQDKTENALLTLGAKDYAGIVISQDQKNLLYGLKWNDVGNDVANAHGTFDLREGATLTLGVALSDNTAVTAENVNGWDGRSLEKAGKGTLVLNAANTYTGETIVSGGTLKTGIADAFTSTSGVTVTDGATLNLGGNSQTVTNLNNSGTLLINDADAGVLENTVNLYGNVINSGTFILNNCTSCAGQTLTVNGDWTGNDGTVSIGTVLGGDDSRTDKLVISGAATGKTYVAVTNEGGTGAQTLEGIEVITTGNSTSDAFTQKGRIVAGSYEYHLQQGTSFGTKKNNWYLTSFADNPNPQLPEEPGDPAPEQPENPGNPENPSNPENPGNPGEGTHIHRPEPGGYASNLAAAATMFNIRLKDRQGGGVYIDPITGEREKSSLWIRSVGGHTEGHLSDGQSEYSANRMVFQMGSDILTGSLGADDVWHLGVMGGYGRQNSNTHNRLTGYNAKGIVQGYNTGIYGTWYQNAKDKTGLYADSWLAYSWFDNSVKGDELAYEKYKSKGLSAALESGYKLRVGSYTTPDGMENTVYVTPQAQVLWSGVRTDDHTERNGTKVQTRGDNNVQTRLGVRLSMVGQSREDRGTVRTFEPFVEANWIYKPADYGVKMGDATTYLQGQRNVAELKAGVEGSVSKNLSVWGSVAQQVGANSYQDTQGVLGVKYAF